MKDIIIIGTGGCAREVCFLLEQNNKKQQEWNILGFIDNNRDGEIYGYPILGDDDYLLGYNREINVVCAVGETKLREKITEKFKNKNNILFPNIISHDVIIDFSKVRIGKGCVICAGSIITVDIVIGNFVTVNLSCTISHDSVIDDFVTINSGSNISGNVHIGKGTYIGTGTKIIQGKNVGENAIIGAGAVVIKDIPSDSMAVGVPAYIKN